MKLKLIYFDDLEDNLGIYQDILEDVFEVIGTTECSRFPELLKEHKPHGILVDLHMPEMDGLELCQRILSSEHYNQCPVFFISGDDSQDSRLKAISLGAIDFLSRLIQHEELKVRILSKVKIYLKRTSILEFVNLRLDTNSFMTFVNDKPVDLTLVEMRILNCLLRNMPDPLQKSQLLETVWGDASLKGQGKIQVHIFNLNLKLVGWNYEIKIKDNSLYLGQT